MSRITINGISIDPETNGPQLAALNLATAVATESNYVLVQTRESLSQEQRERLEETGVELLEHVPENTYIGYFEGSDLAPVQALSFVEWANPYLKGFKIAPALLAAPVARDPIAAMAMVAAEMPLADDTREVDIVLHRGVHGDQVRDQIAASAGLDAERLAVGRRKIRVRVQRSALRRLAEIDEVRHIEQVYEPALANNVAGRILRADRVHNGSAGLRGSGQVVAVCDTGFDRGSTSDVHPAFTGRVKKLYDLGRHSHADDPNGHGTHVAGSVLGDGQVNGDGSLPGTAPEAALVLQSVLDSQGGLRGIPDDLNDLLKVPYGEDGARVHTNSWGLTNSAGEYTSSSEEVDEFVWENRDMVICFAAGNPGRDSDRDGVIELGSVEAPGTAKNCITVGASESDRPDQSRRWDTGSWSFRYPEIPIAGDLWADNPDGMAAFSGRGPTRDGRIKPDVVAPGTSILSACSRRASVGDFWGTSPDSLYCYMGGTSMATPLVAGCAAVVRQHLIAERNIERPSAALVKAMLINGAVDLPGQYAPTEAGPPPNFVEGFGRVDLERTLSLAEPSRLQLIDEDRALEAGEAVSLEVEVPETADGLKVTLVWTDPPGDGLQNDLDLTVRAADDEERHGNMPAGASGFDRRNNVELVAWPGLASGLARVIVRAHRIALHPQSFALVIRML